MTNEPIIIDDVNVAECNFLLEKYQDEYGANMKNACGVCMRECSDSFNKNCYYKQLKRKEQECEEWKKEIEITSCANIELSLDFKKYEKAIDEIEEIADNNCENPEMERILNIIGGLDV